MLLDKRRCGTVRSKVKDGDIYHLVIGRRSRWQRQRRHGYVARTNFGIRSTTAFQCSSDHGERIKFCRHFHTGMPTLHWHLINQNGDIISLCIPVCCKMLHRYIETRQTKGVEFLRKFAPANISHCNSILSASEHACKWQQSQNMRFASPTSHRLVPLRRKIQ